MRAGSVLVLWLASVSVSYAAHAHAPRRAVASSRRICDPQTTTIKKFPRKPKSYGGPLRKPSDRALAGLSDPLARLNRASRAGVDDDDDEAIQNDAPAAHLDVDPPVQLVALGLFVEPLEQQPHSASFTPRSPRGPPSHA